MDSPSSSSVEGDGVQRTFVEPLVRMRRHVGAESSTDLCSVSAKLESTFVDSLKTCELLRLIKLLFYALPS